MIICLKKKAKLLWNTKRVFTVTMGACEVILDKKVIFHLPNKFVKFYLQILIAKKILCTHFLVTNHSTKVIMKKSTF